MFLSAIVRTPGAVVASLPAALAGTRGMVTDALLPAFAAAVVGGGTVVVPVFSDGTIWRVG